MQLDDELRQIFLEEVDGYLGVLTDPGTTLEARGDAAHGLKGAAGMLGYGDLQSLAETLEKSLRAGDAAPLSEHLPRVQEIVESIRHPDVVPAQDAPADSSAPPDDEVFPEESSDDFDPDTMAMLRTFFVEEAREHLGDMETELARLEQEPQSPHAVDALFRSSHTLKGAAATVGLGLIAQGAHRLEDRFEAIRDQGVPLTAVLRDTLVRATDLLRAMVDEPDPARHEATLAELLACLEPLSGADASLAEPSEAEATEDDDDGWDAETRALLLQTFTEEARDILDALDPQVEALWKASPEGADLDALFRLAHTLKGSAAAVGLTDLSDAAHGLEDHFDALRLGQTPSPAPDLLGALAALHDLVDAAGDATASRAPLERMRAAMAGSTPPSAAQDAAAPSPPRPKLRPPVESLPELAPLKLQKSTAEGPPTKRDRDEEAERVSLERRAGADRRRDERRRDDERLIRVNVERFDALLSAVGGIVFRRTLIERRSEELTGLVRDLSRSHQGLRSALVDLRALRGIDRHVQRLSELEVEFADEVSNFDRAESGLREETEGLRKDAQFLQDGLTQIRLLSVRYLFAQLRRAVRDIARKEGKQVVLQTEGEETEIDRVVAEKLADPMIQIIRNAVAHGIESPETREAHGKPKAGTVTISATQEGNFVTIEVRDDGAGIDVDSVRAALVQKGLMSAEEAEEAPEDEITAAIFLPGLSTRRAADSVAGRGVGLDVVRDTIVKLGGEVAVASERNQGTRFQARMPLSTAVTNALLFKSAGEVYCIPVRHVAETRYVKPKELVDHRGRKAIQLRGRLQPVIYLEEVLGQTARRQGKFLPTIVLRHLDFEFGVVVDKLVGPREIVLRKLGPLLEPLHLYTSATISGAGKVQMVLDVAVLHEWASAWRALAAARARALPRTAPRARSRILVCDDSRSIRQVVSRILAEEGFDVELAADGWDAWERMGSVRVDLLLTDLEMPRMDGYALVEKCRKDPMLENLPILVLSSRTGEENQRRAHDAGADGFLFKPVNRRVIVARINELLKHR